MAASKIFLLCGDMEGWGAQRLIVHLLCHLDRSKFAPQLVLFKKEGVLLSEVPGDIEIYDLGWRQKRHYPQALLKLRALIKEQCPALLFSTLFHANVLAILSRMLNYSQFRLVVSEQNSSVQFHDLDNTIPQLGPWLARVLYPKADCAVAISHGVKADLVRDFHVPENRIRVLYNPIDVAKIRSLAQHPVSLRMDPCPLIINTSRFDRRKGHSVLIQAFKRVRLQLKAKLLLVGDGTERSTLEALARSLGLENDVIFAGYQSNPYPYLGRSSLFVLPSLYEGLAVALLEAMALGLPVIASDCPHGPAEVLEGGRCGILVPMGNEEALADAMLCLLRDKELYHQYQALGRVRAEAFSAPLIVRQYESLFSGL